MKVEENDLIAHAKQGDINAFEQLILRNEKNVYNIAYRMMHDVEDAKDIAQEVFLKAYKNLNYFDGRSVFSTWIYRITVNTCIDELRKRKEKYTVSIDDEGQQTKLPQASPEEMPEERLVQKEAGREILVAMEQLSEEHRTILTLRDLRGFSYEEISDIIEVSMGTVKSRLARARKQLKQEFLKKKEQNELATRHNDRREEELREM